MKKWLRKNPWFWFALLFVSYVIAWMGLISIAVRNQPPPFEEAGQSAQHDEP